MTEESVFEIRTILNNFLQSDNFDLKDIAWRSIREACHYATVAAVTDKKLYKVLPEELFKNYASDLSLNPHHKKHMLFGAMDHDANATWGEGIKLLQLDTDYGLDFMFCDCGLLDFWISEEDLKAKRFDRVNAASAGG